MKIQSVSIKNFRNIENLSETLNGANILLLGENQVGKSNFMKAIEIALGASSVVGVDQVMHGKKDGSIQVVMDDKGNEYTFQVKFKEGSDKPTITVTAPDGLKNTAKSVIGSIVGEIEFDIDKFVEMSRTEKGRKEQVEIVKSFLPADTKETLRKYENSVKVMYDERTEINREIKTIEGFIKESEMSDDDMKTYAEPKDLKELNSEITAAISHNEKCAKQESDKQRAIANVEQINTRIAQLTREIEALKKDEVQEQETIGTIEMWQLDNEVKDIKELQQQVTLATEHNLKHEKVKSIIAQVAKRDEANKESLSLTEKIDSTREMIATAIRDCAMPIDGLSFTDDCLTYNGSIVDESTLSTSEIMMLGAKLKMAKNPNARVLCIERGESLGSQKLKDLQKMAKDYDFQIIMEQVQRGTGKLVIEIMPEELETV